MILEEILRLTMYVMLLFGSKNILKILAEMTQTFRLWDVILVLSFLQF